MKIETLKDRIKKAEEKLIKINGTLGRHQKQLEKKAKVLTDQGIDLNNYNIMEHRQTDLYWDICDYDSKLRDVKNNEKKVAETEKTLNNLKEQLENQLAKESEIENSIPEVLNIFLENWKQKCFEYYIKLANEYIELISKEPEEYEITREELEKLKVKQYDKGFGNYRFRYVREYTDEQIETILNGDYPQYKKDNIKREICNGYVERFRKGHFASDISVIDDIRDYHTIDNTILNKILDDDVKVKKDMFVSRIKEVIGDIKDLQGLKIVNGELNGIAIGTKCNAKVETISAGGWNIQCYHFRVLVNTIK